MRNIILSVCLCVCFNAVLCNLSDNFLHLVHCDRSTEYYTDVSETQLFFYDFNNNMNLSYTIGEAGDRLMQDYKLDITKKFILFVPGFRSQINKKPEEQMRQTFSDVNDTYLAIIDHSPYTSSNDGWQKSYERSVTNSYYIGKAIGEFLVKLKRSGFPSSKIHAVGYSLGGQILATSGEYFTNATGEKISRITGLDPAGPCFSNSFIQQQLRSGLADYVEVFHCNAGGFGTTAVLGDVDFFLNKRGAEQPNCGSGISLRLFDETKCSHKACVKYWTFTVKYPGLFVAYQCDSYKDYKKGTCAGKKTAIAGYHSDGTARGIYYASTGGYTGID